MKMILCPKCAKDMKAKIIRGVLVDKCQVCGLRKMCLETKIDVEIKEN